MSQNEQEQPRDPLGAMAEESGLDAAYMFAAVHRLLALLEKESIDYLAADVGAHWRPLIRLLNCLPGIVAEGPEAVAEAANKLSGLVESDSGAAPESATPEGAPETVADGNCVPPWVYDPITGRCVWPGS